MAKYKIIPSSRTIVQSPISIGHKDEKGVEAIEFDLTAWVGAYGSGTLTVIMRRWGDAIPYPIALEIDEDNKATWTLSDIDTAKAGMAYAQLNYIVGDEVVKKSDIYTFRVMDSLTGEGEPPEAYESWLEHLTHLAAEAMAEVLDIEGIVTDKTLTVDGGIADGKATGDALALKADKSTTYTKTEVDRMIEGVEVETDTTLEVAGAAADAAETGRQIGLLKADLDDENNKISNILGSITFDKTRLQMTEAATGAVLNDGKVHTEGSYGENIVHSSVSVTSDYVGKILLVTGYCWFAIEPFVFVGTSGGIVNAGFPNPGNNKIVYRDTIFIPKETGTLYVNGFINKASERAVSEGSIYGIDSDWMDKTIEDLQEKPYSFEGVSYSIQNSYIINSNGLVIPLVNQNNCYVVTSPVDVSNISKVHITASTNRPNAFFAFYDKEDIPIYCEAIKESSETFEYYDDVVIVPNLASTLRVAYYASDINNIPVLVTKAVYQNINLAEVVSKQNGHTDILSDIATPVFSGRDGTLQNGKYLNGLGAVGDFESGVLLTAPVTPGENIEITGECWGANYYYSFFNSSDAFISGAHGDPSSNVFVQYVKTAVVVPDGATKVCVSGRNSAPPIVYEISGYKASKWEGKKWVVVGDSLTEHNKRTTKNYHDYISEATGITVVNMGVSGSGYRNATSAGNKAFYQRISGVPTDADVVTIFGSFNDGTSNIGTADDTGTETLGGCVNTTIDNLYAVFPTVQLGIVSPTPWNGANPYDHPTANAYADLLEAICKKRSIPFLNLYYESNLRPWDSTFRTIAYSKDDGNGVHPDETGHKLIASRFEAFLDSLLLH